MTRTLRALVLIIPLFVGYAGATTPLIIEIKSRDEVPSYTLNNRAVTLDSLREWMTDTVQRYGDNEQVVIRPARDTSIESLFAVLRVLSASGVAEITISVSNTDDGQTAVSRYLKILGTQVIEERGPSWKSSISPDAKTKQE